MRLNLRICERVSSVVIVTNPAFVHVIHAEWRNRHVTSSIGSPVDGTVLRGGSYSESYQIILKYNQREKPMEHYEINL